MSALALLKQFRKGTWTNDPGDDNYGNHWNRAGEPGSGGEVQAVYPAQIRAPQSVGPFHPSNNVNVVVTDREVRVDTPAMEGVGPIGSLANRALNRSGLAQPLSYPLEQVQIEPVAGQPRVNIGLPDGRTLSGKTDLHIGRSSELSAGDQLRNLGRMLRR